MPDKVEEFQRVGNDSGGTWPGIPASWPAIPEKRPKSVTIKRNERSRSPGTGGHVQTEWAVTMGRNMHSRLGSILWLQWPSFGGFHGGRGLAVGQRLKPPCQPFSSV